VESIALVLNEMFRMLGCLVLWWLGMAAVDGRTGQSGAPPDRSCSLSGALPRHPTVRVWGSVDRWRLCPHAAPDKSCSLSDAPLTLRL
jgi:hypothetical protein